LDLVALDLVVLDLVVLDLVVLDPAPLATIDPIHADADDVHECLAGTIESGGLNAKAL
jgi:hypothetical protein